MSRCDRARLLDMLAIIYYFFYLWSRHVCVNSSSLNNGCRTLADCLTFAISVFSNFLSIHFLSTLRPYESASRRSEHGSEQEKLKSQHEQRVREITLERFQLTRQLLKRSIRTSYNSKFQCLNWLALNVRNFSSCRMNWHKLIFVTFAARRKSWKMKNRERKLARFFSIRCMTWSTL